MNSEHSFPLYDQQHTLQNKKQWTNKDSNETQKWQK